MLWSLSSLAATSAFDKPTLERYVRHLFVWGPQIQVSVAEPKPSSTLSGFKEVVVSASNGQASQEEVFFVSNDGQRIIRGAVYDVARNPFQADRDKIATENQPGFGPATAPVNIVMFSDFQCGFCKDEARVIRQNVVSTYPNEVRVYFKDYPLEPIHPWAKPAAIAGRCVFRQQPASFWAYHDWVFEHQGELNTENLKPKTAEWAKTQSLEPIQLAACIDNKSTEAEVTRSQTEGRGLGVNSTPTMFVNGRRLVGQIQWPQLKQIIDHEIEYQKTQGGGEKCCEVTLPTPFAK